MEAGDLDRRIRIERFTASQDAGSGEEVKTWTELATVWAEKSYRRANEAVESAEVAAMRVLRFAIRWQSVLDDLNPKDRIRFPSPDGVIYDIIEVNEIGRREGIEIFCAGRSDQ